MRLMIVTNLYPPQELGGYGRSLADFAWGLQQRGHEIIVLTSDSQYLGSSQSFGPNGELVLRQLKLKGSFENGVSFIRDANRCRDIDLQNNLLLEKSLNEQPFQGILLGNIDLLGTQIFPSILRAQIPVIHHIGFIAPPYQPIHYPKVNHYQLVSASKAVRTSLHKAGFPVDNAPVVYPGARVELFGKHAIGRSLPPPLGYSSKSSLGSPSNPLKIAFAGLLMGSKGAHTLVEAAGKLQKEGISLQLNLAGGEFQEHYWHNLKKLAAQSGLEGLVNWVGQLNRKKLARFYMLHHIGVFPSNYPEAFGIVGAEMQASGLALISSGVGGAKEIIKDGISGILFEAGNTSSLKSVLLRLVNDECLIRRIAKEGEIQTRESFSVSKSSADLEQIFLSLRNQGTGN